MRHDVLDKCEYLEAGSLVGSSSDLFEVEFAEQIPMDSVLEVLIRAKVQRSRLLRHA